MGIQDRKERERKEMRELILNAADSIVKEEGVDGVSIRKIASKIEYSPAIIYHYFKDKEDIINSLIGRGYKKIVDAVSLVQDSYENPWDRLREMLRKYITAALRMPEEYKTIMLNSSSSILNHTSTLFKGAAKEKPALRILYNCIKEVLNNKNLEENTLELITQLVWTSTFGLIIRILIEKDTPREQQELLINYHIDLLMKGIIEGGNKL